MNIKRLQKLKSQGKIRGFSSKKAKAPAIVQAKNKSAAVIWLDWNLKYWCEKRNYELAREYQFHPVRKFRFDYAIINLKIAIEYEGGIYMTKSGHNTAAHYTKDTEKYNLATVEGWKVLRFTAMNYRNVLSTIEDVIKIVNG